jgi:hypothetical protein
MPDRSKLPIWAQTQILTLEGQVRELKAHIERLEKEAPDSNVKVSFYGVYKDYGLPMDSYVDFYLGESRQKYRDMVTVQHLKTKDSKVLRISTSGQLVIRPGGGCNAIEVATEGY